LIRITFSVLALLVLLGTLLDFIRNELRVTFKNPIAITISDSFSVIKNMKPLINTKPINKKLSSIDGIRALFTFYGILSHEYQSGLLLVHTKNVRTSASWRMFFDNKYWILNNWHFVDTFFMVGGLICFIFRFRSSK
jgi:hypothetical protein